MTPFFLISPPRACGSLLLRMLNSTPGVTMIGESDEFLRRVLEMHKLRETSRMRHMGESWPRHHLRSSSPGWKGANARLLREWVAPAETDSHYGVRSMFLGRQGWDRALSVWSEFLAIWPSSKFIFLTRDQGEIEASMMSTTRQLKWIPNYGKCVGCCGGRVHHFLQSMRDFHELNPARTTLLDAADLPDYDKTSAALARIGMPLDRDAWQSELAIQTGGKRQLEPGRKKMEGFDPFAPGLTFEEIQNHLTELELANSHAKEDPFSKPITLAELHQHFDVDLLKQGMLSEPSTEAIPEPAPLPPGYKPKKPRRFKWREKPLHDRVIVYPWLSTKAVGDELRYSIRSIEKHFADKECPIYILGDAPPPWLVPGGRVRWVEMEGYRGKRKNANIRGYFEARAYGLQLGKRVMWMNDDFYLLNDIDWEDLKTAFTSGELTSSYLGKLKRKRDYLRGLGRAAADLIFHGKSRVMNHSVHSPYYFEFEKSQEILKKFHINHRGSLETLYHGWHDTPYRSVRGFRTSFLPTSPTVRYYNHVGAGPDETSRRELERLCPIASTWENPEMPAALLPPPPPVDYLPTLSISIMAHPARQDRVTALLEILGPIPVAMDDGRGLIENAASAWRLADRGADFHLVLQDDAILCEGFVMKARRFLATCPRDAVVSFFYGNKQGREDMAVKARTVHASGEDRIVARNVNAVALCLATGQLDGMLGFYDHSKLDADDQRIFTWARRNGRRAIYPLPSLVNHAEGESLTGSLRKERGAVLFEGFHCEGEVESPECVSSGDLVVHTIRYGSEPWMVPCVASLESWVSRHGYELRIWETFPVEYPSSKFVCVDMLREFLAGDKKFMIYVDADVAPSPDAGPWEAVPGFRVAHDSCADRGFWRGLARWHKKYYRGKTPSGWVYRNAGVWSCDRESAALFLEQTHEKWIWGCMEQHQFNIWWGRAAAAEMKAPKLDEKWNLMVRDRPDIKANFYHLAGSKKMEFLERLYENGFLARPAPFSPNFVWITTPSRGVPHDNHLLKHHPDARVFVHTLQEHEGVEKKKSWRMAHRAIREFWRSRGGEVGNGPVIFAEADVLVNAPLPREMAVCTGMVAANVKTRDEHPGWTWWKEVERLPEEMRETAIGVAPLALVSLSAAALDRVCDPEYDAVFECGAFCEIVLPTVVKHAGFHVGGCDLPDLRHFAVEPSGPGIWHSVKEPWMANPTPLILTACIDTGDTPFIKLRDRERRMVQYAAALLFWLEETDLNRFIFVEGSNAWWPRERFSDLAAILGKEILWVDVDTRQESSDHGKGRGEGIQMNAALDAAEARGWLGGDGVFYKVTGRLMVKNFARIQDELISRPCGFARSRLQGQTDTRFYKCGVRQWREWFAPQVALTDDSKEFWMEHAIHEGLRPWGDAHSLTVAPDIAGESGSNGSVYGEVEEARMERAARFLE